MVKRLYEFEISESDDRMRLDNFLFERIGALSRMHLRRLIKEGECFVSEVSQPPGYKLKTGDQIKFEVDESAETGMKPENIPLQIIYEDTDLLVVDKPAGMLVHPTKGVKSGTLINALSYHLNKVQESKFRSMESKHSDRGVHAANVGIFIRPGLTHRLDKQTSGLMLIAKKREAHRKIAEHFQRKLIEKKYYALVEGLVQSDAGEIRAQIGYDEELKIWRVKEDGKESITRFVVLERRKDSTLLELEPVTGRTNQLRIHSAFINHLIIGDTARGGRDFLRLCLHAAKLKFRHPTDNRQMEFSSDLPIEMR